MRTKEEYYEQITLQQSSIYDGPATQLIKTKISNHHSETLHKDYPNCEEITEKQEKTFPR